jgi:hypothetical protein
MTRAVTPRELRVIEALMRDAERVRELRFERAVEVIVQDATAIQAYVDSQIEPDKVDKAMAVYTSLGLIDANLDLRALWLRLMGEQVVGYYDIDRGKLVVRDDVMRAFASGRAARGEGPAVDLQEARVVLVHELVHALQDQRLGLAKHMQAEHDTDQENALRALVEGDATLAMISHVLERESIPLSELTRDPARIRGLSKLVSGPMKGTVLDSAPAIVRVSLLSAYVDGLTFVAALHGAGGFRRVDRAYEDPPVASEHVLHPQRFARREPAERIRLPQAETLLGAPFTLVAEDTLGELETSVYFSQGVDDALAARAAEGWGGDRLYVFRRDPARGGPARGGQARGGQGELAAVWVLTWDDERQAVEAERAARAVRAGTASRGSPPAPPHTPPLHTVERTGRALLITRGVPPELLDALRARFGAWLALTQRKASVASRLSPADRGAQTR